MKLTFSNYCLNNKQSKSLRVEPSFGTNGRIYKTESGRAMGTMTYTFRNDLDWKKLIEFELNHFKNHNKVNIIQFAASDGSEAYSKIISFFEKGKNKNIEKFFPIQAYDIDKEIITAAQSGLINIYPENMEEIHKNCSNYKKYFRETSQKLKIKNNLFDSVYQKYNTYIVADNIRKNVIFNHADMYDILFPFRDNSDTILMCRNLLGYLQERQVQKTVEIISRKLKEGSLFIIGELDTSCTLIEEYLKSNNFLKVMKNVFKKL